MTRGDLSQFDRLIRLGPTPAGEAWLGRARTSSDQLQLVVIEALSDELTGRADLGDQLAEEAAEATRLSHPHLVQTHGAGMKGDDFCIVHSFAFGEPLGELTDRRRSFPVGVALRIATDVASALAYGHREAGVVHGAIHPMVVFVGPDGRSRLGRFGTEHLVRRARHDLGDLGPERLSYLSPEHCLNDPLDARTDVFNLGTVLWELLTGRLLFEEEDEFSRMQAICDRRAPPASQFRDDLPPLVNSLVRKALAIEPDDRFADGAGLEEAFDGALRRVGEATSHEDVADFLAGLVPDRIEIWDRLADATARGDLDEALEAAGELLGADDEDSASSRGGLDATDRIPADVRKSLQEGSVADVEEETSGEADSRRAESDRTDESGVAGARNEEDEGTKRQKVDQLEKLRDIASDPIDESEDDEQVADEQSDPTVKTSRQDLLDQVGDASSEPKAKEPDETDEPTAERPSESELEQTSEFSTDEPTVDEEIDGGEIADLLDGADDDQDAGEAGDSFSETDEVADTSSERTEEVDYPSRQETDKQEAIHRETDKQEAIHKETEEQEAVGDGRPTPGVTAPAESDTPALSEDDETGAATTLDDQPAIDDDADEADPTEAPPSGREEEDVPDEPAPTKAPPSDWEEDVAGSSASTDRRSAVDDDGMEARETLPDDADSGTPAIGSQSSAPDRTSRRSTSYPDEDVTTEDFEPDRPVSDIEPPSERSDETAPEHDLADGETDGDAIADGVERLSIDDWLDDDEAESESTGEHFPLEELVADRHEPEQERVPEPALELIRLGAEGPVDVAVLRRGDKWRQEEVPVAVTCERQRATIYLAEPATGWLLRAEGDGRRKQLPEPPEQVQLAPGDIAEVDDGLVRYRLRYFHPPKRPDHVAAENRTRKFGGYALAAVLAIVLHAVAGFGIARLHSSTDVPMTIDDEPRQEKFAKGKLEESEPEPEENEPEPEPPPEPPDPPEPVDPAEQEPDVPDQVQDEVEEKLQEKQQKTQDDTQAEALAQALQGSGSEAESGSSSVDKAVSNIDAVDSPSDSSAAQVKGSLDGIEGNEVEIADSDGSSSLEGLGDDIGEGTGELKGREDKGGEVRGTVSSVDTQADVEGRLSRAKVRKTIDKRMGDIQGCYEDQLLENAGLSGKITLEWTVTRSGNVTGAREKSSSLGSAAVSNCILGILRQLKFPKPKGGSVSITYPFVFQSG